MARKESKKRKSQPGGQGRYLSKASKKLKKSLNDLYEAEDSDPDEEKHQQRYDVSGSMQQRRLGHLLPGLTVH
jgi:hypothetical protein